MTTADPIPGLKLIHHTGVYTADADDPALPFKLTLNFSPPEAGGVGWVFAYGGSEIVIVRAQSREAIDQFLERNAFKTHPRLRRFTIEAPGQPAVETKGMRG